MLSDLGLPFCLTSFAGCLPAIKAFIVKSGAMFDHLSDGKHPG